MTSIIAVGEPLIEFTQSDEDACAFRRGLGGDTLNTAVYLARLLGPGTVSYMTRLGSDSQSDWIVENLVREGIRSDLISRSGSGAPGLSMIECDSTGERSFTYWRSQSPARSLFSEANGEDRELDDARGLFVSSVTLAIMGAAGRERLLNAMRRARARGAQVWFDLNFRPQLWDSNDVARRIIGDGVAIATTVLPSLDDVSALWEVDTPEAGLEVLFALGAGEVLMKTGGGPVIHFTPHKTVETPLPRIDRPLDTTGAGDSFNAGFIAARWSGKPVEDAIQTGHALASAVVLHRGAIIPRASMPALPRLAEVA